MPPMKRGDWSLDNPYDHQLILERLINGIAIVTTGSGLPNDRLPLTTSVTMVEVGVANGQTSEYLLRKCPTLRLLMVDSWTTAPNSSRPQETYDRSREFAYSRTEFAAERRYRMWGPSLECAENVQVKISNHPDWVFGPTFDIVFIDADHRDYSVLSDCAAWWPLVKPGGVLCGHDYDSPRTEKGQWGVPRAVKLFSRLVNQPFSVEKSVWVMNKPV